MLKKRLDSFKYAFQGIADLFKSQANARIHLSLTILVLLFAWYFKISSGEWIAILICIAMVFSAEAMNTALEYLTDLVSPEHHVLAGKAKDAAAASVLFLAIGAAITAAVIFLPKVFALFQ